MDGVQDHPTENIASTDLYVRQAAAYQFIEESYRAKAVWLRRRQQTIEAASKTFKARDVANVTRREVYQRRDVEDQLNDILTMCEGLTLTLGIVSNDVQTGN